MKARETIFSNIKRSLQPSRSAVSPVQVESSGQVARDDRQMFDRFIRESARVENELVHVGTHQQGIDAAATLLTSGKFETVMVSAENLLHDHRYYEQLKNMLPASTMVQQYAGGRIDIPSGSASVVVAWGLIAETGTVVFVSSENQPRSILLLPETLVIVAQRNVLAASMEEIVDRLQRRQVLSERSCVIFMTGPSRTSDIEKILVKGVHGPRRIVTLLLAD